MSTNYITAKIDNVYKYIKSRLCVERAGCEETVGFGKSDKTRKINEKVDKPSIDNGFSNDISSFI